MKPETLKTTKDAVKVSIVRYDNALIKGYGVMSTMAVSVLAIVFVGNFPDLVERMFDPGRVAFTLILGLLGNAIFGVMVMGKAKAHNLEVIRTNGRLPKRHHFPAPDDVKRHRLGRWLLGLRDSVVSAFDRIPVRPVLI